MKSLMRGGVGAVVACVAAWSVTPSTIQAQHFPSDDALREMLRYLVEDGEATGIVLGVLEADGSTRIVSYGSGGPDARPLGPQSRFEIGSITKTFTTTLLAEMAARGEVSLDDPVSGYLPDGVSMATFQGNEITLLDLATHYSGISDTEGVPAYAPNDLASLEAFELEDLYRLLGDVELTRAPGDRFEYSNLGVGLLAHVLALAAAKPLDELVEDRVLDPLEMEATDFARRGADDEWMTLGYRGGSIVNHVYAPPWFEGAGALRSNMADMLRYLDANVGPAMGDLEAAMREAHLPRRGVGSGDAQVGLAWRNYTLNDRPIVAHNGDTEGFSARLAFDPDNEVGLVILTNSAEYASNLGTDLIVHDPKTEHPTAPVAEDVLASYEGAYLVGGVPSFVRFEDDGALTLQPAAAERMRLYPTSDSTFYALREEWAITFRSEDGEVSGLTLDVKGRQSRGVRVADDTPPAVAVAGNSTLTPDEIASYEGVYDLDINGQRLEYRVYGTDGLLMSHLGVTESQLIPVGGHRFAVRLNPSIRVEFELEGGQAARVTLQQGAQSDTGERRR